MSDKMKSLAQIKREQQAALEAVLRAQRGQTPNGRRLNQLEDSFAEINRVEHERTKVKNYHEEPEA